MTVATLLNPEIRDSNFLSEPFRPEEIRTSFEHGNYVFIFDDWANDLFLPPDAAAIGVFGSHVTPFEEFYPCRRAATFQRFNIVFDFQQPTAASATINHVMK